MSKSIPQSDVDDILLSIKRLVVDPAGREERRSVSKQSLFLLTPAHRVDHDDELAADISDAALDLSIEPEMFREAAPHSIAEPSGTADEQEGADEDDGAPLVLGVGHAVAALESAEVRQELSPLEQRIAELEQAVGRTGEQWEPDGSEPQEMHQPKLHFLERYRKVAEGDKLELRPVQPEDDVSADLQSAFDDIPPFDPEVLKEIGKEAAQEQAVSEAPAAQDDPEPDRFDFNSIRNREPPLRLADVATFAHTPNVAQPADAGQSGEPAPTTADAYSVLDRDTPGHDVDLFDADQDLLVDEEMLRTLVSDIVRDELQGRMGERITRNVRRMVRQEIERALQIRSLK